MEPISSNYQPVSYKIITYDNVNEEDCQSAGGMISAVWDDGVVPFCTFAVEASDTTHDNVDGFGTANISIVPINFMSVGRVKFINKSDKDNDGYWYDSANNSVLSNYSLQQGQTYPYVYYDHNKNIDSENEIAPYVNNYKNILEEYGITISDARLISYDELVSMGCQIATIDGESFPLCWKAPGELYNQLYWTGSNSNSGSHIFVVNGGSMPGIVAATGFDNSYGIRPVISVAKSIFN